MNTMADVAALTEILTLGAKTITIIGVLAVVLYFAYKEMAKKDAIIKAKDEDIKALKNDLIAAHKRFAEHTDKHSQLLEKFLLIKK